MILAGAAGIPVANTEIRAALQRIDARLDLLHQKPPAWGPGAQNPRGSWLIVMRWRADDKRRELIQRGDMRADGDFDYVCELPGDCPPEEARAYFERAVAQHRGAGDIGALSRYISQWNAQVFDDATEPLREAAAETFDRNKGNPDFVHSVHPQLGTIVKSYVGEATAAAAKRAPTPPGTSSQADVTASALSVVSEQAAREADQFRDWLPMVPAAYADRAALARDVAEFLVQTHGLTPHAALTAAVAQHALTRGIATIVPPAAAATEEGERKLSFTERMRRAKTEKRDRDQRRAAEQAAAIEELTTRPAGVR